MKRLLPLLLLGSLQAEEFRFPHFSFESTYQWVAPARFYTPSVEGEHLQYNELDLSFSYSQSLTPYSGFTIEAGYIGSHLNWRENPFFSQDDFHYVNASVGLLTSAFPCWEWLAEAAVRIDTAELDLAHFALYQGLLWGQYTLCEWARFHVGFLFEGGLNRGKIWPILGFNFFPDHPVWELNLVYPFDLSFVYQLTDAWYCGGSLRLIRNRHRLSESLSLPLGIFEYEAHGIEFDLYYTPFDAFELVGFVGGTYKAYLRMANSENHDAQYFKMESALYAGGSLNFAY